MFSILLAGDFAGSSLVRAGVIKAIPSRLYFHDYNSTTIFPLPAYSGDSVLLAQALTSA